MGVKRRQALRDAVELQDYQFNCHGVEMGQVYGLGLPWCPMARTGQRRRATPSSTTTRPLSPGPTAACVGPARPGTLVDARPRGPRPLHAAHSVGGNAWREVAAQVAATLRIALDVASIGGPKCDAQDVYGRWAGLAGISESGCLLVRPDRHIAWRQQDSATASAQALEQGHAPCAGPAARV